MSNQDWVVIVGMTIVFAVVVLVVWGLAKLSRWFKKSKSEPELRKSTPPWIWVFLIAVVALITYVLSGRKPDRAPAPASAPNWVGLLSWLGPLVVLSAIGTWYQYYRHYDRAASRALKRGQAGDTEGAIAELRAAIEESKSSEERPDEVAGSRNPYSAPRPRRKGSAVRSNMMGILHFMREEWAEAYEWFLEAEEIGGRQAPYLANQGLMLWRMGRPEEGAALLEEACSLAPAEVVYSSNLGQVLVDLGRIDEAHEQLASAEANFKKLGLLPASAKRPIANEIELLRKKLASFPDKRDRAVFEEL